MLYSITASAQKCKVAKDEFTGEKVITAAGYLIAYEHRQNKTKLTIVVSFSRQQKNVISKGAEIMLKPDNGDPVKLSTISDTSPNSQVFASQYSAGVVTYYSFQFEVDKATMNKFIGAKRMAIRGPSPIQEGQNFNIDSDSKFAKKYAKELSKASKCMIESI